jgi:hypothetical protein
MSINLLEFVLYFKLEEDVISELLSEVIDSLYQPILGFDYLKFLLKKVLDCKTNLYQ